MVVSLLLSHSMSAISIFGNDGKYLIYVSVITVQKNVPYLLRKVCFLMKKISPDVFLYNYHCVKRVRIRSYSGPPFSRIFPHSDWIQRDTEYLSVFSLNAGKCGKNADQNNSEYGLFLSRVQLNEITQSNEKFDL